MIPKSLTSWILLQAYAPTSPIKMNRWCVILGYYSNLCRGRRGKEHTCESDFGIEDDNYKGANKS